MVCLEDETIGAYAEHSLELKEIETVEEHLVSCGECLRRFISVREMLSMPVPGIPENVPSGLLDKAKGLVLEKPVRKKVFEIVLAIKGDALRIINTTVDTLQLLGTGLANGIEPIPIREAKCPVEKGHKIEGVVISQKESDIDFQFEVVNIGRERCRLRLTLKDVQTHIPKSGIRVSLCEGERILQSQPTDKLGKVTMEDVSVGNYMVRVIDVREWEIPLSLLRENAS